MRSYSLHRRPISLAFVIVVFSCALAIQTAAQTPQQKAPLREPFGSSLNRPKAESPARESSDAKEKRAIADSSGLPQPEETIKVDTLLVSMDVVVTDQTEARFITGLKPEDFVIVEDNVPQKLATLTLGNDAERERTELLRNIVFDNQEIFIFEPGDKTRFRLVCDDDIHADQQCVYLDGLFRLG